MSRRLFPQAAEVIFKGTADLFQPRHFISLYRPTSGLSTVEGKKQGKRDRDKERERERGSGNGWRGKGREGLEKKGHLILAEKRCRFFRKNSLPSRWNLEGDPAVAASRWLRRLSPPRFPRAASRALELPPRERDGRRFNDCRVIEVFQERCATRFAEPRPLRHVPQLFRPRSAFRCPKLFTLPTLGGSRKSLREARHAMIKTGRILFSPSRFSNAPPFTRSIFHPA